MDENSQMFFPLPDCSFHMAELKFASCHVAQQYTESIMQPIDIAAIEQHARALRAAEIQRVQGLFAQQAGVLAHLAAGTSIAALSALGEVIRPFLSWNPQDPSPATAWNFAAGADRLNGAARALFSWNPQDRRH
jgi:hypothetical protein